MSEAEHLSDLEDQGYSPYYDYDPYDYWGEGRRYFEPYDDWDKAQYIAAKTNTFSKSDVGKWVIIQNSRRNKRIMPFMYLVDRSHTKRWWWSPDPLYAMIFDKRSAAEYQAKKYKYNKARVIKITASMADQISFEIEYGTE